MIDEIHTYRGVFGSNLANVLRRLLRLCDFYGSHPQFILCSATIANPKELAETLTGREVSLVDDNGAPDGRAALRVLQSAGGQSAAGHPQGRAAGNAADCGAAAAEWDSGDYVRAVAAGG